MQLAVDIVGGLSFALICFIFVQMLFEPGLTYWVRAKSIAIASPEFRRMLGALCDAEVRRCNDIEVLTNGVAFYPAELAAIAAATASVHIEAYTFRSDSVGKQFVAALAERARNGVGVKVVVDAVGSWSTADSFFNELRTAGGQVVWYQPLHLRTFKHWNNRTHRKMIILDSRTAFCGGADIGEEWLRPSTGKPAWRDTVCYFTGDLVNGLQSTFAENWLEASGEILADDDCFPCRSNAFSEFDEASSGLVVNSTPTGARGTRAHILYQVLVAYASSSVHITTPYFLPDRSSLAEIVRAVKDRGVRVTLLTPGARSDHLVTRVSSRRRYGELLKAGVEIYEYLPSMIHAKIMVVDGLWSVVGSTNFDRRSLGLNDEINVAVRSDALAQRLEADLREDLSQSRQVTLDDWSNRGVTDRLLEPLFRIFDRQF